MSAPANTAFDGGERPDGSPSFRVIVVDDDAAMRDSLEDLLLAADWTVETASRALAALDRLNPFQPDVVLSDVRMPDLSGLDLLERVRGVDRPPVVLISAHGDIPMAVEAVRGGAYTFIEKPYEPHRLLQVLRHAAEQHRMTQAAERMRARLAKLSGLDRVLLGDTPEVRELRDTVIDLAAAPAPVLLLGETGTGKELVARALHDLGPTSDGPFVALNAASIDPQSVERALFGGVETPGRLREADGGTLFLDEVCSCPEPTQAKLLRALETGRVETAGREEATVRFRLVSASNREPEAAVREGKLRADFLYRVNALIVRLPPLRRRLDDVPFLFRYFLDHYARLYELEPPSLANDDLAALLTHRWPGNVRELRHVAERRVLAARRGRGSVAEAIAPDQPIEDVPATLREAVASFEREIIGRAVRSHGGRMDAVAEALGIGRRTLNDKIVKLGLDKDEWLGN